MTDLDKAREWAERWSEDDPLILADAKAAIKLIKGLPDQWVDVEKVRWILHKYAYNPTTGQQAANILNDLESLLAPKLPTLADMAPEEREACQWMQARVEGFDKDERPVIAMIESPFSIVWEKSGSASSAKNESITPLPDLPKLEWPGNEAVETPALPEGMRLADHEEYGRVVVSPETDQEGDYLAFYSDKNIEAGVSWVYPKECELTFLDGDQHA